MIPTAYLQAAKLIGIAVAVVVIGFTLKATVEGLIDHGRSLERADCTQEAYSTVENNLQKREQMNEDRNNRPDAVRVIDILQRGSL